MHLQICYVSNLAKLEMINNITMCSQLNFFFFNAHLK